MGKTLPKNVRTLIALSVIFLLLFAADLSGAFIQRGSPVARLKSADGVVSWLPKDSFTWNFTSSTSAFFSRGETIATGDNAGARIEILGGGEVELGPHSMVYIGDDPSELKLNFIMGRGILHLTAEQKRHVVIQAAPGLPKLSEVSSEDQETIPPLRLFKIHALPEASLRDPSGRLIAPEAWGNIGVPKVQEDILPPKILVPDSDAMIDLGADPEAKIQWAPPENLKKKNPKYEISLHSLGDPAQTLVLQTQGNEFPLKGVKLGRYALSIRTIGKKGKAGLPSQPRIVEIKKLDHFLGGAEDYTVETQ